MKKMQIDLYDKEEYDYAVGGFLPNIVTYLHEDGEERQAVIVVPGGGYVMVAIGEGELVARKFYEMGYQAFVLTYTTSCFQSKPLGLQPLQDISRAVACIRKNAADYHVIPNQIALCGFSAGANLCATLAVHFNDPVLQMGVDEDSSCRPDAVILSYPVITDEEGFAHRDSFLTLCGADSTKQDWDYFSAEKHVTENTPPVFLWHTATDETVPVENSYLMAKACQAKGILYEMHIFPKGPHGYSLANEEWAAGEYGDDYPMNQFFMQMQYYIDNELELPAPFNAIQLPKGTDYREVFRNQPKDYLITKADPHVAIWPVLADQWLKSILVYKETLDD